MKQWTPAPEPGFAGARGATVALIQALFYVVTGIWPWLSMRTFLQVTGPKQDLWLVKTVGVLIIVIGLVLGAAGLRRRVTPEIGLLAVGSAGALAGADLLFVSQRRIPPVYLLDTVAELGLVASWVLSWRRDPRLAAAGEKHVYARY